MMQPTSTTHSAPTVKIKSRSGAALLALWRNRSSRVGVIILAFFLLVAAFGPLVVSEPKSNYRERLGVPTWEHPLGTDYAGKDTLSQLILGARGVLVVAAFAGLFSILFACAIGITAGLVGGKVDAVLMMITNIVITIPSFPVTMILSLAISVTNPLVFGLLLSVWTWAGLARAIRAQVLTVRHKEFIEASRVLGLSTVTIILNDVLPSLVSYIAVNFISIMRGAIMSSVGLMYLGLVPFQGNHWGNMMRIALAETGALMGSSSTIYLLAPVTCIILFQLGCYLFATGLDDALNPKLSV